MNIVSKGDDLALVIPGQGTYLFRNYCLANFNVSIHEDVHKIRTPWRDEIYYVPGVRTVEADIRLKGGLVEHSNEVMDQYDHLSVLELFDLIQRKLEKRE